VVKRQITGKGRVAKSKRTRRERTITKREKRRKCSGLNGSTETCLYYLSWSQLGTQRLKTERFWEGLCLVKNVILSRNPSSNWGAESRDQNVSKGV